MDNNKIYPSFLKKIKNELVKDKNTTIRAIISFNNVSDRDNFISKNSNLKILEIFQIIPSLCTLLNYQQIQNLKEENLVKSIEEDQKLILSISKTFETIGLNSFRKSHFSFTGKNVRIGIIDSGINKNFDSISKIIIDKFNLNEDQINKSDKGISHGTIMANIIGNQYVDTKNNPISISPEVKIYDLDISKASKNFSFTDILEIFDLIQSKKINIGIILISFTTLEPSDGKDILSLACNLFVDRGFIIICPAGNFGPEKYTIGSPSAAEKVITIGSITERKLIANFSSRGPTLDERVKPDFYLPGSRIQIPISDSLYVETTGTSVSAAICVGIIALLKEYNSNISYKEVFTLIKESCIVLNYNEKSENFRIINVTKIFENLDLYHEKLIPYKHLMRRSFKITVELVVIFLLIYLFYYFFTSF